VHEAVALHLADLTADAQHHAVGARRRIVHAVLIGDERASPAAQIYEVVPVGVVARQAGQLQAHHQPDLTARHGADQPGEAGACLRDRSALPLILVDDHHAIAAPAELNRLVGERILSPLALQVVPHLPQRRLPHVDEG